VKMTIRQLLTIKKIKIMRKRRWIEISVIEEIIEIRVLKWLVGSLILKMLNSRPINNMVIYRILLSIHILLITFLFRDSRLAKECRDKHIKKKSIQGCLFRIIRIEFV
jgi:hypothetical protein